MKHKLTKILFALAITLLSIGFSTNTEKVQAQISQASDGNWYYYNKGKIDKTFTGLDYNQYGWWYVKNGKVDFTYNGTAINSNGEWLVRNGKVDFGYTGVAAVNGAQYRVVKGKVDYYYYGLMKSNGVWYNLKKGKVTNYSSYVNAGPVTRGSDTWYTKNGKVDFSYTGVDEGTDGKWFYRNGKLDVGYKGLVKCSDGNWRYNDRGNFPDNRFYSLVQNENGWWAVKEGVVDFSYTAL